MLAPKLLTGWTIQGSGATRRQVHRCSRSWQTARIERWTTPRAMPVSQADSVLTPPRFGFSRLLPARLRPCMRPITRYIWTGIAAPWMSWHDGGVYPQSAHPARPTPTPRHPTPRNSPPRRTTGHRHLNRCTPSRLLRKSFHRVHANRTPRSNRTPHQPPHRMRHNPVPAE